MSNSRNFSTLASNVSSGGTISTNVLIGAFANTVSANTIYLQGALDQVNTNIVSANTQLKSYTDGSIGSANTQLKSYTDGAIGSANTQLRSYTDGKITYLQSVEDLQNTNISTATTIAQGAFNQANTATTSGSNANILAQNAYDNSNTKFSSSGGNITGQVTISSNLTVTGNLTVSGNVTTVSANNLVLKDNMIYLNDGNTVANPDLGIAGNYNDGIYRHAGFFRDASDGVWKVYDNYLPEPDASPYIDTSNSSFRIADFQANNITAQSISLSRDFKLPVGNTAQRPPSSAGKLYFNNETNKFEGYGTSWGSIGGGALIGDTPPSNPSSGDLWWNSSDGKTYIYYGTTWVQAQPGGEGQYLPLTGGTVTGNITNVGTLTSNNIVSTANVTYSGTLTGGTGVVNIGSGQIYKDASGNVGIGTNTIGSGLEVVKPYTIDNSGATSKWTARFRDSTAYATGVGGSLLFQGIKSSGGSVGNFAGIAGLKENATDNNEQGYLSFYTTPSSGVITERGRFDSVGSLVLGPSSSRFAYSAAAGDIVFNNGLTDTPGIQFQYANNTNFGIDSYSDGTNYFLRFVNDINQVGGSQNINFSRTGVINLGGRMVASGSGIAFPQTQSASTDANTLDDYEEGTWTPIVRGAGTAGTYTLGTYYATYVKIGRVVHLNCALTSFSAASGGTGYAQITNLPFSKTGNQYEGCVRLNYVTLDTTCKFVTTEFISTGSDSSTLYFTESVSNGAAIDLPIGAITTSSAINLAITYLTAT